MNPNPNDRTLSRREVLQAGATGVAGAGLMSLGLPMIAGCERRETEVPASFRYNLTEAARIDPQLITWRQTAMTERGLQGVVSVAVNDYGMMAAAVGDQVLFFDPHLDTAHDVWQVGRPVSAVTWAADGLWIATHDQVARWADGVMVHPGPTMDNDRTHITAMAVNDADLYIADAANRQVIRYRDDTEVWRLQNFQVPSPYFDLCLDGQTLWVAHCGRHRLEAYDSTGELLRYFGETGLAIDKFCGCCNPCHFTMLPDGRFVTAEKGLNRVKVLSEDGTLAGVVTGAAQLEINVNQPICRTLDCSGPAGPIPAVLPDGGLAVCHPITGRVHLFEEVG